MTPCMGEPTTQDKTPCKREELHLSLSLSLSSSLPLSLNCIATAPGDPCAPSKTSQQSMKLPSLFLSPSLYSYASPSVGNKRGAHNAWPPSCEAHG